MSKSKRALLKTPTRLMPVVLLIGVLLNATWAQASALELFYDDDEIDAYGIMAGGPENAFVYVVSFHSPWESSQLLEAKFYLRDHTTDYPSSPPNFPTYGYPCIVVVMDTNRARIFEQEVTPSSAGWVSVDLRPYSLTVPRDFYVGVEVTHSYQEGDIWVFVPFVGYDSDDPDGESWLVHVLPPSHPHGPESWRQEENWDFMIRAVVAPSGPLQSALDRLNNLQATVTALYEEGVIDWYKYNRIMSDLATAEDDILNAIDFLNVARLGFDDKVEGLFALKSAVSRLEYLIRDLQNWVNWDYMPSDLAEDIIQQLEAINLAMADKAKIEAESERMLAEWAIWDAECRLGYSRPWLWNEISYIDQYLAYADYWLEEGWLSKAVSYYKNAFHRSQRVVRNAWHWSWDIDIKDWIDIQEYWVDLYY